MLGGKVVTSILGVVLNALLARLLTPRELGAYFTSFTLVLFGSIVCQLGLDVAVVRFISSSIGMDRPRRALEAIRRTFLFGTVASVVVALALILGLGGVLARVVFRSAILVHAIPAVAGWLVAVVLQSLTVESFRGFQRFDFSTLFDALLVEIVLASLFAALWATGIHVGLSGVVLLTTGVTALVTGVGALLLRRRYRQLAVAAADRPGLGLEAGELVTAAWPLLVTRVTTFLVGSGIDIWVIGAVLNQQAVAKYGSAARLVVFVATPFVILQGVTPPLIAELYAVGRKVELERAVRATATLAGLPAAGALLVFLFFGRPVMTVVFGPFYADSAAILAVLSVGRLVAVWSGSCGVALMMTGHQRTMMYISLVAGAVSIIGDVIGALTFGVMGVAVATTLAVVFNNLLQLWFAKRQVGIWTHAELSPRSLFAFFWRERGAAMITAAVGDSPAAELGPEHDESSS